MKSTYHKQNTSWRVRTLGLLLALVMALGLLPSYALAAGPEELYDGLIYRQESFLNASGQNVNAFVVEVDLGSSLTFAVGVPNDSVPLAPGAQQTVSGMAKAASDNGANVVAAFNADFFYINDTSRIQPEGLTVKDGTELSPFDSGSHRDTHFFGILNDGAAVIGDGDYYAANKDDVYQAVGGAPLLIANGEIVQLTDDAFNVDRHPRTAVGIKADGSVLVAVADGRTTASYGVSLFELAAYMKSLGAVEALNLDGGGSSTCVVRNVDTLRYDVKNYPSGGSERPVGNALFVIDRNPAPQLPPVPLDQDGDGYYLIRTAEDFSAINLKPDGNFRLAGDIDLNGAAIPMVNEISGIFDGNGKSISNLKVNSGLYPYALFDQVQASGVVRDFRLESPMVTSSSGSTAFIARNCYGLVEGITINQGAINAGADRVGGIVGNLYEGGYVKRCAVGADITGAGGSYGVGGIAGYSYGGIEQCYVNANISGVSRVGGIVGYSDVNNAKHYARNCIASGSLYASGIEAGGVGGLLKVSADHNIIRDMNITTSDTSTAVGSGNVAGFLGAWCNLGAHAYNVIQSGTMTVSSPGAGYRIGYHSVGKNQNYVNPAVTINGATVAANGHNNTQGADATVEQLNTQSFYVGLGYDFTNIFGWEADASSLHSVVLRGVDMTVSSKREVSDYPDHISTADTAWKYLDNNSDPGTAQDRYAWTRPGFDDGAWKSAYGSFGAKNGGKTGLSGGFTVNTLLNQYISGTTDIPAYFFRTEMNIEDASKIVSLTGSIAYDDAAIIYVNGVRVAAFNETSGGYATNMSYGSAVNLDAPETKTVSITDTSMLVSGANTVAVELHNNRSDSSDIYLDFISLLANEAAPRAAVKNVVLNIGATESRRNVVWYGDSAAAGEMRLALKSSMTGDAFPTEYQTFNAVRTASGVSGFGSYQATAIGLTANTEYIYRVGNNEGWSDIYSFKTGSFGGAFSFLAAGDPQIGSSGNAGKDTEGWTATLNKAESWFGDGVDFLISLGDQVETNDSESQYDGFLSPNYLRSVALATNIGNHDSSAMSNGVNYKEHFNMPNSSDILGLTGAGGDYWYSYNGALFLSINTNNRSTAEHSAFLSAAIEEYKASNGGADPLWKLVTFHHSIYSSASHTTDTDIRERRNELSPVFARLGVDAVLAGHDHVYTRSYMMGGESGMTPITEGYTDGGGAYAKANAGETLYITANSASGSKYYALKQTDFQFVAAQNQENTPNITKVDVTADALIFTTYRTGANSGAGDIVDTFTLSKQAVRAVDKDELNSLIAEAASKVEAEYAPGGWAAFATALNAARTVSQNDAASQEQVDAAVAALRNAMDALIPVQTPADKLLASIRTNDTSVETEPVEYIVSLRGLDRVGTVKLTFTADGNLLSFNGLETLNGFTAFAGADSAVAWKDMGGGLWQGEVTLIYGYGAQTTLTSEASVDVARIIHYAKGLGNAAMALTGIQATGLVTGGDGKDRMEYIASGVEPGKDTAVTSIGKSYSAYDLDKNGEVDQLDLAIMVLYCQIGSNDARWSSLVIAYDTKGGAITAARCDVNADGTVDMLDLLDLYLNYTR
ncbi:MAG: phosphodiester glycosidase family protein [Clostridiales Family XIII bacterium]|nr:phosphodiester glycosidase family protein [Clostridiales Family XIII bacterium]